MLTISSLGQTETRQYYRDSPQARTVALLAICVSLFLMPMSLSAILVAVPAIATDLNADAVHVSWVPIAFMIGNMMSMLPCGKLGDILGRKRLYLVGLAIYVTVTMLAGLSQSIEVLLCARFLQGISSALVFSQGLAIIGSIYQDGGRGSALGWTTSSVYLGLTAGPFIGGLITDGLGWRYVFYLQVPLAVASLLLSMVKMPGEWLSETRPRYDWKGTGLLWLWVPALFLGASALPGLNAIIAVGAGLVALWLFVWHSNRIDEPLVRLRLVWRNKGLLGSLLAAIGMYAANFGLVFLVGLYLQYNRGLTPTESGQFILLQALAMAIMSPLGGRLADTFSPRIMAGIGSLIAASGFAGLAMVSEAMPVWFVGAALALVGVGMGLFSPPNTTAAMAAVPADRLSVVSALVNMSRLIGQMFGTIIVAIFLSLLIGSQAIAEPHYPALFLTLSWVSVLSAIFALLASSLAFLK